MPKLRPSDIAWLSMVAGILAYEWRAPAGELLSEGWDRYLQSHPVAARVFPLLLILHVINALPQRVDPFHWAFCAMQAAGRKAIDHEGCN
ncbi:hypothetical protein J4T94_gp087 [Mycobacterium phage Krypton555]|uniref:Uncharacterized protein n=2 Tax=Lumosvirus TaxID=2948808 RepID=A0A222ZSN0_9CAUD|nr:hypothetical protein N852_gp085 [Mycobacterium phage Whirlwind]YP_010012680.1 hypothetical protein J4T94_gp087 [Mycobacterium phage Krypton555]AGT12700.1 hypothetical protein PBI_WHIRLWIND_94 [Mycobacterium phage Whirlwind]ASR87131.1 hypothetical protein KRYPTON555_95 [Mycobacterium phage Krypton555]